MRLLELAPEAKGNREEGLTQPITEKYALQSIPSIARNDIWNPLPELFPLATKSTQRLREWPVKMTGSSCDRHVSKITPVLGLSGMGS